MPALHAIAYLLCFAATLPVVGFALFFRFVDRAAASTGWRDFGHLLLKLLEFVGTPWRIGSVLLFAVMLVAAGCMRWSRGWGCLAVGGIGLLSLAQVFVLSRPTEIGQIVFVMPSAAAAGVNCFWAWQLLRADLAS